MPTSDGASIEIIVYTPKSEGDPKTLPCYIYAHGGYAVSLSPKEWDHVMVVTAVNLGCVAISVDYRKGPEVKCPTGQRDFVEAVHYVIDNAQKFNVDTSRICLAGCSGGGWIVSGAANLMVKSGDISKIKALFIHTGMLSDETQHLPADQLAPYENDWGQTAAALTSVYKLHATDFDQQQEDDQLYPGRAADAILSSYPPTVIWTSEFDFYLRDNQKLADRLKSLGKLAEISLMPGTVHGYQCGNFESQETKWFLEEEKLAF